MRQIDCTIRYALPLPIWETHFSSTNWKEIDYQIQVSEDAEEDIIEKEILAACKEEIRMVEGTNVIYTIIDLHSLG